jgi:hypothetical protein
VVCGNVIINDMESSLGEPGATPPSVERVKIEPQVYKKYQQFLETRIVGQPEATGDFARLAVRIKSGIRQPSGLIDSKFLVGPSGVGKTDTALSLSRLFDESDGPPLMIKVDCGLLTEPHSISKIVGVPPGYVGSDQDPRWPADASLAPKNIAEKTITYKDAQGKDKKLVVIVFDEIEKANPTVQKLLLVALDKGTIQTGGNKDVDLSNAVILFTSNLGNQEVEQRRKKGEVLDESGVKKIITSNMEEALPPEFRGRLNDVIVYRHLNQEAATNIAKLKLQTVQETFASNGINIDISPSDAMLKYLITAGDIDAEGARAIIKLINEHVFDNLVAAHTDFNINGREIILDLDQDGKPSMYFGGKAQSRKSMSAAQTLVPLPTDADLMSPALTTDDLSTHVDLAEDVKAVKSVDDPAPKETGQLPMIVEPVKSDTIDSPKPIEEPEVDPLTEVELKEGVIAKLKEELEEVKAKGEKEDDMPPIPRLMDHLEYIYDLSERMPELADYLRLSGKSITIKGERNVLLSPSKMIFSYQNRFLNGMRGKTEDSASVDSDVFFFPLKTQPQMGSILQSFNNMWDRWDDRRRHEIRSLSKLTRVKIVQRILDNLESSDKVA